MTTEPRKWHLTIAGNTEDAVEHGLTVKAKCGLVWIPTILASRETRPDIEECEECYGPEPSRHAGRPHYVYRCYDAADRLIYVGCTVAPRQRLDQHRSSTWWHEQVARVRYVVFPNKEYALFQETVAIRTENPRWNVKHRDLEAMTLADFRDMKHALTQNGAGEKRLARLDAQCIERFGESA